MTTDDHVTCDTHVTGRKLTTTPDNSDAEDVGKNNGTHRANASLSKITKCAAENHKDRRKNQTRMTEEKFSRKMENLRSARPECFVGLEDTQSMEDNFRQRVMLLRQQKQQGLLQLQQQLGLTTEGFVIPSS